MIVKRDNRFADKSKTSLLLEEQTVRFIANWLNGHAQRVVISSMKSSWRPVVSSCTPGLNIQPNLARHVYE